jgi:hypothetical protein
VNLIANQLSASLAMMHKKLTGFLRLWNNCLIVNEVVLEMKLKQVGNIESGYPFRGKIAEVQGAEVAVVQMKNVSPVDGVDWSGCVRTRLTGKREPNWLNSGDILVAARGSRNYAVKVDLTALPGRMRAVAAPHFFVINVRNDVVISDFLVWFLNQNPCQRYFRCLSKKLSDCLSCYCLHFR